MRRSENEASSCMLTRVDETLNAHQGWRDAQCSPGLTRRSMLTRVDETLNAALREGRQLVYAGGEVVAGLRRVLAVEVAGAHRLAALAEHQLRIEQVQ